MMQVDRRKPVVFLALPHRNDFSLGTMIGAMNTGKNHEVVIQEKSVSLLARCFNELWCDALNMRESHRLTHFAMMHCDIGPDPGWLDVLLDEQRRVGADIMSAISPIKDRRGLTSTAIRNPETGSLRRLTMTEVCGLEEWSFDADLAGYPGHWLLANTGLWVCDFTKPWVEDMHFRQQDGIVRDADGKFRTIGLSEDWIFSMDAHMKGLSVWATKKVVLRHKGEFLYPNVMPWGEWKTDNEPTEPEFEEAVA